MTTEEKDDDLQKIRKFLEENSISLVYTDADENYIDFIDDRIIVSRMQTKKEIVYTILHEIGHYFCDFFVDEETHTTRVIEEVLAWDVGRDVAHALRIDVDEEVWKRIMISSIQKYIEK